MEDNDLCPLCGGVMASITHAIEAGGSRTEPLITSGHLCYGHPAPQQHDGKLEGSNTYTVEHIFGLYMPDVASIKIGHDEVSNDEVWLSPRQALSLLDWLLQEKPTLERLAKEQAE